MKQLRVKDGIPKHFTNNRDLRISTHDHPLMSLKDGSKLLEEMSPFHNRRERRASRRELRNRGDNGKASLSVL